MATLILELLLKMNFRYVFLTSLSLALLAPVCLTPKLSFGQAISTNGGAIQGTITDNSGAAIPGATVVVTSPDTGYTHTLKTDGSGFYSLGPLIPGNYVVAITATGFQQLRVKTVIRTGTATAGSEKLTVGNAGETVEVNAGQLQVNTDQAGVQDVLTRDQVQSLPINGRNFLDLAQVEPGVILQDGQTFDPTKAGYSSISVDGVSGRTTRILYDGQDITDETVGTTIINVPTGAVDEFQLNRSTQDVSGEVTSTGQVLVSSPSGTNTIHGQLFYNFQDHRAGFARTTNGFDAPFQRNQFGGSMGGPIVKNKLFFFGDLERIKQDSDASATSSAIFSDPSQIAGDPALSEPILQRYPLLPEPFRDTFSVGRLDYNGPFHGHYFARAYYEANAANANFTYLYSIYKNQDNIPGIVGGADFTSGKFTHSFRVSYEKFHNLITDTTAGDTGIYNPNDGLEVLGLGFYAGPNYLAPQGTFQSDKQVRYDGTWTKGSHTVKYGASLNRLLGGGFAKFFGNVPYTTFGQAAPLAQCYGAASGVACPGDPINGYKADSVTIGNGNEIFTEKPAFGLPGGGVEDWRSGYYVADTWKATQSLTVIAGLRYSIDTDRANQDLPTPPCSSVVSSLQFPGCTGSTALFDQFQAGLGQSVHQPYGNVAPQAGFVFSPGAHKFSVRGGIGIFYENDIFNNTSNGRSTVVNTSGPFFNSTALCGGTNSVPLPGGGLLQSVNGVPLSTFCNYSIAQAAPYILGAFQAYQAATQAHNTASNPAYIGNTLYNTVGGSVYGAPYRTPYSIQINGGIEQQIAKGTIIDVDYIHNGTLKVPLVIDVNHVGSANHLNAAAAKNAIATTLAPNPMTGYAGYPMCPQGSTAASIDCAIANGATITNFASFGLDSGITVYGGAPASLNGLTPSTGAAFAGINPNVGAGYFILPAGQSSYDALQMTAKQVRNRPAPGIESVSFQISYSFSLVQTDAGANSAAGSSDQFFNSTPYDMYDPKSYSGRASNDRTNELSFGGSLLLKYGPQIGLIGHFFSAPPSTLTLPVTGGGEIFRTDVTGDGTTGDLLPGTLPGDYMHRVKPGSLSAAINNYNSTRAGTPTPAGNALISAGLFTNGELVAANAVQQPLTPFTGSALPNSAFRSFDVNAFYPIRLAKLREGLSLVPGIAVYNVANLANFAPLSGILTGSAGSALNGGSTVADQNGVRVQRGAGTFDQGAPRTTEFQLKLNF